MNDPGGFFLHLNRDGRWPGFAWRSLEAGPGGRLALASLPAFLTDLGEAQRLASLAVPDGPAGLAIAPDGTVLWTDAVAGRLFRRDPCDGHVGPVPLAEDVGLVEPRALAVHAGRHALLVADAGGHEVRLVDLDTDQLVDVWGGPGTEPGRFDRPTGLAVDAQGAVYVADSGNRRVQKLDRFGVIDAAFGEAVASSLPALQRPEALAFDGAHVWILDPVARVLAAVEADGTIHAQLTLSLAAPAGLFAAEESLHVGDNASRRLVRIDAADGHPLGEARGFEGPVAALAASGEALWLHPGGSGVPVRLERRGGAVRQGLLWGGPIALAGEPHAWQRLNAIGDTGTGRVRFFVHAGAGAGPSAPDPGRLDTATGGFDPPDWRAVGEGVPDAWVGETSERLWIGALVSGDGRGGPAFEQLRLSFDEEGYAKHLPAIYRVPAKVSPGAPESSRETLERFLALFESFFDDCDEAIAGLRRLLDPASAPAEWLDWLAGWLAFPLEEGWPEGKRRRLLADAFARAAWRGTSRGLARALSDRLGIVASIEEPHAQGDWWVLPAGGPSAAGGSRLGLSTRLAPAAAQGAVLGTTAVLDRSHLVEEEDAGEPLFTPTAYQFTVVLPRSQASAPATLERVRELVEREKPAHTAFGICLVDPGIRVGYQALLGVDTILGDGGAPATRLGEGSARGAVLGGARAGRIGSGRIGESTRLGEGAVEGRFSQGAHGPAREETPWAQ